jgi:hypothetical protein
MTARDGKMAPGSMIYIPSFLKIGTGFLTMLGEAVTRVRDTASKTIQ